MSDSAPIAQVTAREIPVTIQGSQIVEGTDRRELFTETVKTVLVFDNGAAVNLKARVAAGQSLFLRNELSGREILCRVIEAPPAGQEGCTDLEFTIHDPDFWSAQYEERGASAEAPEPPPPQAQEAPAAAPPAETAQAAEARATAEPSAETGAPETTATPESQALPSPLTVSGTNEIPGASALLAQPPAETHADSEGAAPIDDAKDAERLAGIVAKYARALAKRASEKGAAKEAEEQLAADGVPSDGAIPEPSGKQKAFSTLAFRMHAIRELTVKKNPIALGIVSCIVIGSALGVAWDVTGMLYPNRKPILGAISMRPAAPPAKPKVVAAKPSPGKPAGKAAATPAQAAKVQPPTPAVAQVPAARIQKNPTATAAEVRPVHANGAENFAAIPAPATGANNSGGKDLEDGRHRIVGPQELIPAKIVSQFQPSLPPWAKALDLQGTVKLDAVIDEKGNLKAMKVLSGPRALESAAESAVGLWIFAPAISSGRPVPTHMIITVEFQR